MEEQSPSYFRKHGHVHALWLIAVLLFVNGWNLMALPNGDVVREFIGFAASLASLILAIVAIFYSFVSNRESQSNLSRLGNSAEKTEQAARAIFDLTKDFKQRIDRLGTDVESIKPTMKEMSGKVSEVFSLLDGRGVSTNMNIDVDKSESELKFNKISNGAAISLYLISESYKNSKFINIKDVFPQDSNWQGYAGGFLQAIELFKPLHIGIVSDGPKFSVHGAGNLDFQEIEKIIDERLEKSPSTSAQKQNVDKFFSIEGPASEEESEDEEGQKVE